MHLNVHRVLLALGTILPLIFPFGIFLSRRPHPKWVRLVSIFVAIGGVTWGVLGMSLTRHLPPVAYYRAIASGIVMAGMIAIVIEDYMWKKRARIERRADQT
jgi:branched-subunit amino acid transport protein AzlD